MNTTTHKFDELKYTIQGSPMQRIDDNILHQYAVELWIKRDDCLHPIISGNKWRKLKYIIDDLVDKPIDTIVSMGGAHSNHLHALAYLGQCLSIKTVGLIRGDSLQPLNASLADMQSWGMQLQAINRSDYREMRYLGPQRFFADFNDRCYWLPEGGAQQQALKGVAELLLEIPFDYDYLCVPCGSGTTVAGLAISAPLHTTILGVCALKNTAGFLEHDINRLIGMRQATYCLINDYCLGGFAKTTPQLIDFIRNFTMKTHIPLEPIYTGKMLYAIYDLLKQGYFPPGKRIVAVHTGGLQGLR